MATATHNLDIGFDADVSSLMNKIDKASKKITGFAKDLDKLEKKSKDVDKLSKSFKESGEQVEKLTKETRKLAKENKNLKSKNKKLNNTIDKQEDEVTKLRKQMDRLGNETDKTKKSNDNFLSSYTKSLRIATSSVAIWGLATGAIYGARRALENTAEVIVDVNAKMVDLKKVMDSTKTDFDEMQVSASKLGGNYARSIDKVVEQMAEWGKQGKKQAEVIELVQTTLMSANATNIKSGDSVKYLVATLSQFDIKAEDSMAVIDKFNETANNFANTTAQDIAEGIKETGKAAATLNISLNELIGMTTAMAEATAKAGNRLGRSMRTMLANIVERTNKGVGAMNELEKTFENLTVNGEEKPIALRADKNNFRNIYDVLKDLSVVWDDLTQVQKKNVSQLAGNKRRYSDFEALMGNFETAIKATTTAEQAFGSALKENETYMKSLEAQFQQAKTTMQQTAVTLGNNGLKGILKKVANVVEGFFQSITDIIKGFQEWKFKANELITGTGGLVALTTAIYGVKTAVSALMTTSLFSGGLTGVLSAINPITGSIALLGVVATAVATISKKLGEEKRKTEELIKAREKLNEVMRKGNEVSYNEALAVKKQIRPLEKLADEYANIAKRQMSLSRVAQSRGLKLTPYEKKLDRQKEITSEMIKEAKKYPKIFKKIDESFEKSALRGNDGYMIVGDMEKKDVAGQIQKRLGKINKKIMSSKEAVGTFVALSGLDSEQFKSSAEKINKAFTSQILNKVRSLQEAFRDLKLDAKLSFETISEKVGLGLIEGGLEREKSELKVYESQIKKLFSLKEKLKKFGSTMPKSKLYAQQSAMVATLDKQMKDLKESGEGDSAEYLKLSNLKDKVASATGVDDIISSTMEALEKATPKIVAEYQKQKEKVEELTKAEEERDKQLDTMAKRWKGRATQSLKREAKARKGVDKDLLNTNLSSIKSVEKLKKTLASLKEERKEIKTEYSKGLLTDSGFLKKANNKIDATEKKMASLIAELKKMEKIESSMKVAGQRYSKATKSGDSYMKQLNETLTTNYKDMGKEELGEYIKKVKELASTGKELSGRQIDSRHYQVLLDYLDKIKSKYKGITKVMRYTNQSAKEITNNFLKSLPTADTSNIEKLNNELSTQRDNMNKLMRLYRIGAITAEQYSKAMAGVKDSYADTEQLKLNEKIKNATDSIKNKVSDFSLSDVLGINEAQEELKSFNKVLDKFNMTKDQFKKEGYKNPEIKKALKKQGFSSKDIKKIIDDLNKKIKGTKITWIETIGDGLSKAINGYNEFDTFAGNLQSALQGVLGGVFNNPDLKADLKTTLNEGFKIDGLIDFSGFSEQATNGLMKGASTIANGGSLAKSALAGVGQMMGGSIGGAIGGAVGSVGEALFGGTEGEDPSTVKALKKQVKSAKDYLKEYNIDDLIPNVNSKDSAGALQKFFGGSDIEILNKQEIEKKIKQIKGTIQSLGSGLRNALKNAFTMNTREFGRAIERTIGKEIQSSLINSIMDKAFISNAMGKITEVVTKITDDGKLTDNEILKYKQTVESAKSAMRKGKSMADQLQNIDGLNISQQNTENNTQDFSAGQTSNITYHQSFVVEAGAMMGDEQDAETFAEKLAPYIREVIDRNQGH